MLRLQESVARWSKLHILISRCPVYVAWLCGAIIHRRLQWPALLRSSCLFFRNLQRLVVICFFVHRENMTLTEWCSSSGPIMGHVWEFCMSVHPWTCYSCREYFLTAVMITAHRFPAIRSQDLTCARKRTSTHIGVRAIFSRGGLSYHCPKNFSLALEKNCYANLRNYFARQRLTPPSNY